MMGNAVQQGLNMLKSLCFLCVVFISNNVHAQFRAQSGGVPGSFDFYVLALSWSSGFCEATGDVQGKKQCDIGSNIGFTVHGLWPQFERGFPSNCEYATRSPSSIALQKAEGIFPDIGLARYEWRKHGTCSGLSPSDYFDAVRAAKDRIVIPQNFQTPRTLQSFSPVDITRAFTAENRGLRADMMAVTCNKGVLEELRVCFQKDLRSFRTCPEVARQGCRSGQINVPPVR